ARPLVTAAPTAAARGRWRRAPGNRRGGGGGGDGNGNGGGMRGGVRDPPPPKPRARPPPPPAPRPPPPPPPPGAVRAPGCVAGRPWRCVCYGLGRFGTCPNARHQLAFLLLLLQSMEVPPDRCLVFDPAFSELEVAALGELGLRLLPENEEGKHQVQDSPTLFYMVHCGKALYNNLLWRNWAPATLSNMVIIGNSFKGMQERCAPSPAPFLLCLPFSNASLRDVCVVPKAWLRLSCCHNSSPRASLSPTPAAPRSCREASAPRRARPCCHPHSFVLQSAVKNTGERLLLHSKGRKHCVFFFLN
uniref:SRR1 domain containing n=1 Tax=Anas platyrhynchos platyrhynchos TaxID=8840 RepID=A0A493TH30_ANAPP